jgi:pimeloyl-ACP methyl ester carboxylesterase
MPHAYTNGTVTFYEDGGDGPVVVLIHGHSADLRMWNHQMGDLVKAGFRVVRYDVRGHGRSQVLPQGYTWDNYSVDLAELLHHLNVELPAADPLGMAAVHLVGSSMGGAIALKFAADYASRVLSLTLVDSALPGFTYSPEFSAELEALVAAVQSDGAPRAFDRLWLNHRFFDGVRRHPARFAELREIVLAYQAPEYRADYGGEPGYEQPDLTSQLHTMHVPALVMIGEHDIEDFHLIAEVLAGTMPNARKVVLEGCWHLPNIEKPEVFNPLLIDFLRATAGRA